MWLLNNPENSGREIVYSCHRNLRLKKTILKKCLNFQIFSHYSRFGSYFQWQKFAYKFKEKLYYFSKRMYKNSFVK